jgi:hypothetical protein
MKNFIGLALLGLLSAGVVYGVNNTAGTLQTGLTPLALTGLLTIAGLASFIGLSLACIKGLLRLYRPHR